MLRFVSSLVLVSSSIVVGGCGGTPANAQIRVCYASAASEDAEPPIDQRSFDAVHTGLSVADPDTSWATPEHFTACGATGPVVELIDDDGAHVWLGVDIRNGSEQLVTSSTFADIVDGELIIAGSRIWTSSDTISLSSAGELRLALKSGGDLGVDGLDLFGVSVEDAGADGLPSIGGCGAKTARQLGFGGATLEDGAVLKNSEVTQRGGYTLANLGSWEYGDSSCEDVPLNETLYSWAVIADR